MNLNLNLERLRTTLGTSSADTPLARWSIAAISVILVWLWVVEPIQGWHNNMAEQVERNVKKAVRLQALQARADEWAAAEQEAVELLQQQLRLLFMQASDTAAQASLQQLLVQQAETRGLTLISQKLIEPESLGGIGRKLSVALNLRGELGDVLQFIHDISWASHIVELEALLMRKERDGRLVVQMTVAGYRGELAGLTNNEG